MKIEIDDKSGCCFGVVRAITEAEKALAGGGTVYSLGDIVHNRIEVQRLERLGLHTVTHNDMPRLGGCRLFIRAHGEPPTTYAAARRLDIDLIDATCPVVARLQKRVIHAHERMHPVDGQVVILGKRGHAEVVGLTGQVEEPTLVIEGRQDLETIDFARPIYFLSQTTQSIALFEELGEEMRRRAADPAQVWLDDTICRQVSGREQYLTEFASRFDAVLFVSGQSAQPPNRGAVGARSGVVRGRPFGRHLRRDVDPEMADGTGRRCGGGIVAGGTADSDVNTPADSIRCQAIYTKLPLR